MRAAFHGHLSPPVLSLLSARRNGPCFSDPIAILNLRPYRSSHGLPELNKAVSLINREDSRAARSGLAAFVELWSKYARQNREEEIWRELVALSYKTSFALSNHPVWELLNRQSVSQVEPQVVLERQRQVWRACEPPWIPLLRKLLSQGPQESFVTMVKMRETAIKMAAQQPDASPPSRRDPAYQTHHAIAVQSPAPSPAQCPDSEAPGLHPTPLNDAAIAAVMVGAVEDVSEALRERCLPPWTAVLPVSWQLGPAELLSYLLENEAVLSDKTWDSLRVRTTEGRRVYSLVHRSMPLRPLAFTSTALTTDMPHRLQPLLWGSELVPDDLDTARTAVFYSICTTQKGLAGLDIGRQLIHRTIYAIGEEFPHVDSYVTLSPIPGFLAWLRAHVAACSDDPSSHSEPELYRQTLLERLFLTEQDRRDGVTWTQALLRTLGDPVALMGPNGSGEALQPILSRLCTTYLLERRPLRPARGPNAVAAPVGAPLKHGASGSTGPAGTTDTGPLRVRDPVAHFHFGNGALLQDIHWRGNMEERAMHESLGMMASFRYVPPDVERYLHEYRAACKTPVHSDIFRKLPARRYTDED